MAGKWHVGHFKTDFWPRQRGFDSFYGALVGEMDYFTHEAHGVGDWYRDNGPIKEEGYSTTLFGNEAVRLIEAHDTAKPLYLYLAFNAPHTPYQAPQDYIDRYKDIADELRRTYAAMITCMDEQIGRVVDALDRKAMRENTLIIFHSDNGGTRSKKFTGESKVTGDLPPNNEPYRDGKATLYEGGTRVVALANWPGKIKAGKVDGMMHVVDWYPTFVGLAGGSIAKSKPLDGMDIWATVSEGKASPRTELVYNVEPAMGAVRQGDWKLVWLGLLPGSIELFNLAEDPSEKTNLADANPDKVKELQARIKELAIASPPPLLMADVFRSVLSETPSAPQDFFTAITD
jgi:arylsulfatase A-like enzyme